ncbi:hypothetical protein [Rugosimonospora africana]|uniref:Uncharacterized protein n=1 Tax=Rugosimonospora africana TaxID=556532 RepID=A0A8J3QTJ3_9ACTN|nr:hypothetical protein [Rugosimonospora africana]GIH15902.1 hypothetical protein Raf01_40740 [Rugosimonospora africana]
MSTEKEYDELYDRLAALREQVASGLASQLSVDPQLADAINKQLDDMQAVIDAADLAAAPPPDGGLAQLAGVGPQAATVLGETRMPRGVKEYDETVASERILAVGDLYYVYQHEKIGVFKVVHKLQQLFQQGAVRLSDGPGAFGLYKFDRREVLRYTQDDRIGAYRRVLGYGSGRGAAGSRPNTDFHKLLVHFSNQVALFWRDKRISDVIRMRAYDPSFGSIAIVRRAGLDLRNNLKFTSYGHLNVLRVELMQLLDEAYRILDAPDIKELFGAANAWDVVDEVLIRYFDERLVTSPRQRMGVTGRQVLRWLGAPHILESTRAEFEALLLEIAEPAEEWITSAQSLGLAKRSETERVLPWDRHSPVGVAAPRPRRRGPNYSRRGGLGTYRGSAMSANGKRP